MTSKPLDVKEIRFAPEIECELRNSEVSERLITNHTVLHNWNIVSDYSLNCGLEVKPHDKHKLYWNQQTKDELRAVIAILNGFKAKANKHTGLHIHVDITKLSDKQILNIIRKFYNEQDAIVKRFEVYPVRLKEMCKKLDWKQVKTLTELDIKKYRMLYGGTRYNHFHPYLTDKYCALNSNHIENNGYQTLEFRLFNGTLNLKTLLSAVWFCINFVKKGAELK